MKSYFKDYMAEKPIHIEASQDLSTRKENSFSVASQRLETSRQRALFCKGADFSRDPDHELAIW